MGGFSILDYDTSHLFQIVVWHSIKSTYRGDLSNNLLWTVLCFHFFILFNITVADTSEMILFVDTLFISLLSWYISFCKRFLEIHLKFWSICQISPLESYSFIFPRNVMSICPNHLLWFIYFFHFANPHNNDISVVLHFCNKWGSYYVFSHLLFIFLIHYCIRYTIFYTACLLY